ncbi:ABC transporter permease [Spirillospora sp. CA-142024]|uniref:ABC transporter permease n=1 Tax=Spirillospora sp. CA-142024 TaxID=3240036 RepID=UPI003D917DBC
MNTIGTVGVAGHGQVTLARVVRCEWIKLRTLRSIGLTLLAAVASVIGLGLILTGVTANRWSNMSAADRASLNPTQLSVGGYYLAVFVIGVLGVLVTSSEYSTGTIRATLSAVPKRLPVLGAKAAVFAAVTWVLMTAAALVAFLAGQAVLGDHGTTLGEPGVLRIVLGVGLNLTVTGLLSVGLGMLVRSTAGGIAAVFGLLLVMPAMADLLPASLANHINQYLPSNAAMALLEQHREAHTLAPWTGFAVFCLYAILALVGAALVLKRRDA